MEYHKFYLFGCRGFDEPEEGSQCLIRAEIGWAEKNCWMVDIENLDKPITESNRHIYDEVGLDSEDINEVEDYLKDKYDFDVVVAIRNPTDVRKAHDEGENVLDFIDRSHVQESKKSPKNKIFEAVYKAGRL